MRKRLSAAAGLLLVAVSLAGSPAPPAAAVTGLWLVLDVAGAKHQLARNDGTASLTATCDPGYVAVSGWVTSSQPDDIRRLEETFGFSATYAVKVTDQTPGAGHIEVQAHARCVPASYFSSISVIGPHEFAVGDVSHLAAASLSCTPGHRALGARVRPSSGPGSTLLTSGPTGSLAGWQFRGWHDDTDATFDLTIRCVADADISAVVAEVQDDQVGWGTSATATCRSGTRPINGGTTHIGGDGGAITVHARPTATGWSSTTQTFSTGVMRTTVLCVPGVLPTISLTGPTGHIRDTAVSWAFSANDPAGFPLGYECTVRHLGVGVAPQPCSSPQTFAGLADGVHSLTVTATTSDGRFAVGQREVRVDATAPSVVMRRPTGPFQLALSTTAAWSAQDSGSGVADHAVRWRRAPYNGGFGSWSTPVAVGTTSRSFGSLATGATYCYSASARDHAGNESAWAPARCTAVPLDDRSLTRGGTWTTSTLAGWFRTTALSTKSRGARLSRAGAIVKRINLTALACPACGVVDVYVGSTRVGRVNLAARTTQRRTWTLPAFSLRTGTVSVRVLSSGKLVRIDALGLSRM